MSHYFFRKSSFLALGALFSALFIVKPVSAASFIYQDGPELVCVGGNYHLLSIRTPWGLACPDFTYGHHQVTGARGPTSLTFRGLFINFGNSIVAIDEKADSLRTDLTSFKVENEKWKTDTLKGAMDRIDEIPVRFATSQGVRDALIPVLIEAIKNDPALAKQLSEALAPQVLEAIKGLSAANKR